MPIALIAQLAEHLICNQGAGGSNPSEGTSQVICNSIPRQGHAVPFRCADCEDACWHAFPLSGSLHSFRGPAGEIASARAGRESNRGDMALDGRRQV